MGPKASVTRIWRLVSLAGPLSTKAAAKRNGEDPWQVQARQDRVMDRWSVVIARHNAKAIRDAVWRDSAVDDWPSTPERNDCPQDIDVGAVA